MVKTLAPKKPRTIVIGNWKMNGLRVASKEIKSLNTKMKKAGRLGCDVMICPPATLIGTLVEAAKGSRIAIGAQDCHANVSGAHTGDIAAEMIKDLKAKAVIVGHSERRATMGKRTKRSATKPKPLCGQA